MGWAGVVGESARMVVEPGRVDAEARDVAEGAAVVLARRAGAAVVARGRARGQLERVRWGAYLPTVPSQGRARDTRRRALARIEAVHAQLSVPHWFSHESAALLWGYATVGLTEQVHVTQPTRPTGARQALVRHHGELPVAQRAQVRGLPVTALERTVVDCAATLRADRALVVADSALRLGADRLAVADLVRGRAGGRGVAAARAVLARADGRSESPGETLVRFHLHDQGLPEPDLQVEVRTRLGRAFLDLGWVAQRVGLEFDGFVKYSGELGSTAPEAVFAEKRRQDAVEDEGWRVLRVTWDDLRTPAALAARVARALARGPRFRP